MLPSLHPSSSFYSCASLKAPLSYPLLLAAKLLTPSPFPTTSMFLPPTSPSRLLLLLASTPSFSLLLLSNSQYYQYYWNYVAKHSHVCALLGYHNSIMLFSKNPIHLSCFIFWHLPFLSSQGVANNVQTDAEKICVYSNCRRVSLPSIA